MKKLKKIMYFGAVCFCVIFALSGGARASDKLAVRVLTPHFIAGGDTFTAKIIMNIPAGKELCALAITTVWDASVLTPIGEMQIPLTVFSEDTGGNGFDTLLTNKTNIEKGMNELAFGRISKEKDFALAGSVVIAEQEFKIKEGASGKTRIGFTTNSDVSANGTSAFTGSGEIPFAVITPAVLSVK